MTFYLTEIFSVKSVLVLWSVRLLIYLERIYLPRQPVSACSRNMKEALDFYFEKAHFYSEMQNRPQQGLK